MIRLGNVCYGLMRSVFLIRVFTMFTIGVSANVALRDISNNKTFKHIFTISGAWIVILTVFYWRSC